MLVFFFWLNKSLQLACGKKQHLTGYTALALLNASLATYLYFFFVRGSIEMIMININSRREIFRKKKIEKNFSFWMKYHIKSYKWKLVRLPIINAQKQWLSSFSIAVYPNRIFFFRRLYRKQAPGQMNFYKKKYQHAIGNEREKNCSSVWNCASLYCEWVKFKDVESKVFFSLSLSQLEKIASSL